MYQGCCTTSVWAAVPAECYMLHCRFHVLVMHAIQLEVHRQQHCCTIVICDLVPELHRSGDLSVPTWWNEAKALVCLVCSMQTHALSNSHERIAFS